MARTTIPFRLVLLLPPLLETLIAGPGCAPVDSAFDVHPAAESVEADCVGAFLDDSGACRRQHGGFAPAQCCIGEAAPDLEARFDCQSGFGFVSGRVRDDGGFAELDESSSPAQGVAADLIRLERPHEEDFAFAKYEVVEPSGEPDRYDTLSVPKGLFDGTFSPSFVGFVNIHGADAPAVFPGCSAKGTALPEQVSDEALLDVLAHEYGRALENAAADDVWSEVVRPVALGELPPPVSEALEDLLDPKHHAIDHAFIVVREDVLLGVVVTPQTCSPHECFAAGALYMAPDGSVVADLLE